MVEFCTACGTSLPKGDLTIKKGKLFTSPDYSCPSCGQLANPEKEAASGPEASESQELIFKNGQVNTQ